MIPRRGPPFHETQALEFGHLTTDRGVVATDKARELDDADRVRAPDPRQQGEERSIELHTGPRQERLIDIRPVHVAVYLQENGVKFV